MALPRAPAASTASPPSASTSASRRSCARAGSAKRSAIATCGSRTTPSRTRRCRSRIASSRSRSRRPSELGFDTVACASTGNLANSIAANAAQAGLRCYVFIPHDLEAGKVLGTLVYAPTSSRIDGTYDDVNRLCTEIADRHTWAFVNVNIRPYYAEGSKTYGYEIQEQLGWRTPAHVVVPMASGSLLDQDRQVDRGIHQARPRRGARRAPSSTARRPPAAVRSPRRCSPGARRSSRSRSRNTIAKSLAIGNPADGPYAAQAIRALGRLRAPPSATRRSSTASSSWPPTEGIFTETAGGVTVATAARLIAEGRIPADEPTVLCITGNGLKTQEPLVGDPAAAAGDRAAHRRIREASLAKESRSMAIVRIPTPLRKLTGGAEEVQRGRQDRRRAHRRAREEAIPGIKERICDDAGAVRRFVNIFVKDEDIRFLQNLETPLATRTRCRSCRRSRAAERAFFPTRRSVAIRARSCCRRSAARGRRSCARPR